MGGKKRGYMLIAFSIGCTGSLGQNIVESILYYLQTVAKNIWMVFDQK